MGILIESHSCFFSSSARWYSSLRCAPVICTAICTACHVGGSAPEGLQLDSAHSPTLLYQASVEMPGLQRVQPGRPDLSYLVWKIEGIGPAGEAIGGVRIPYRGP